MAHKLSEKHWATAFFHFPFPCPLWLRLGETGRQATLLNERFAMSRETRKTFRRSMEAVEERSLMAASISAELSRGGTLFVRGSGDIGLRDQASGSPWVDNRI